MHCSCCKITDLIDEDNKKYYRMFDYLEEYEQKQREEAAKNAPKWFGEGNEPKEGEVPKWTGHSTTLAPQEAYELLHSLIDKKGIADLEREEISEQLKKY